MKMFRTIRAKTLLVLSLFGVVFLAVFISTFLVIAGQESDSLVVNVAGRQRMLSQKMTKECLVYVSSFSQKIKKEDIQNTMTLFEKSLSALTDSGETFTDLGMTQPVELPPAATEEIRGQLNTVRELWEPFKKTLTGILETKGNNPEAMERLIENNIPILKAMHKAVGMMQADSESRVSLLILILIIGAGLVLVTGIFLWLVIAGSLVNPVKRMITVFKKVSGGDLTAKVETGGNDEIAQLGTYFNDTVDHLLELIYKVKEALREVVRSTGELSDDSADLAARTNEEAASITETSTTLEELTAIVKQNRENSEDTSSALDSFNKEIQSRNELMTDITAAMKEIHDSGSKIGSMVAVINDISFQTNLLALNAAVEAARAGEAGRGFAVVAAEVRNLAQKTSESSKTIQDIVSQNVESTQRGMELVNQTTEFFTSIARLTQDMVNKIEQITDGSKEQATGVEQINEAVLQLEGVIGQNAALVEALSSSASMMKLNAKDLEDVVGRFNVDGDSTESTPPSQLPPVETKPQPKKEPAGDGAPGDDFFDSDEGNFEEF